MEVFSTLGETCLLNGREISPSDLEGVDLLFIRSITKVDSSLLSKSRIKFIATATSGIDHVNQEDLKHRGISFYSAGGCNAKAVVEYIFAALSYLALIKGLSLVGKKLGIIGVGHVGGLLRKQAEQLGYSLLLCDPPLQQRPGGEELTLLPLKELLAQADIISIHVPLNSHPESPTLGMGDDDFFRQMVPGAILLNTSRGEVIDEAALKKHRSKLAAVVLDVWNNEPNISLETLKMVDIATPHIAGHTLEAKLKGTEMVYQAACEFLGRKPTWDRKNVLNTKPKTDLRMAQRDSVNKLIQKAYPILKDHQYTKDGLTLPEKKMPFDRLRKNYIPRREFTAFNVLTEYPLSWKLEKDLQTLGFSVEYL